MKSQTTVSVVIPAFNAEPWIGETLESVARQTYDVSTLEVIVVDDHSTDRTVDIATAVLKSRLPGGRIVRLPRNAGVSAARNIGWQQAKGDWIQFLDADDLIAPEKVAEQSQFAALQLADVAVVFSKWRRLEKIGATWRPSGPIVEPELGPAHVVDILDHDFSYLGPTLIKRSALVDVGGFRERLLHGEDQELCLRLAMSGHRFVRASAAEPVFFYRQTPGGLSSPGRPAHLDNNPVAIEQKFELLQRAEAYMRATQGGELMLAQRVVLVGIYDRLLRVAYDFNRSVFHLTLAHLRVLQPNYLPISRRRVRMLSRCVGHENAEWVAAKGRRALKLVRQMFATWRRKVRITDRTFDPDLSQYAGSCGPNRSNQSSSKMENIPRRN
jgi:glycosyltransferase involved in cell wall biosynthesis